MLTYIRGDRVGFSERLKELREKSEMTQVELAGILKITRQAVGNYEQGTRFPKDEKLLAQIADIFDVSLDYLLGRVDVNIKTVDIIDKIIIEYINEKKTAYQTNRAISLRKLLMAVDDLPDETINRISEVILILKNSLDK